VGFDISWVDPGSQRFYLADRTATKGTGRIDVVDTQTNQFLYSIPTSKAEVGFTGTLPAVTPGCSISGPNGACHSTTESAYVGDGNSTVKVVDLAAKAIVAIIPTGGNCRADEEAYDSVDHIIMGRMGGLEQPVWNHLTKRFYMTVPGTATTQGSVDVFNPVTFQLEQSLSTPACSPAGLALTASQRLVTSCGAVLDARNGNILSTISGVGGDEIWYNPGENRVYFGATGGSIGIVDADSNQLVGTIPVNGRNVATDSETGRVFVPVTGKGILVFAAP
jgi:hypothetical protein